MHVLRVLKKKAHPMVGLVSAGAIADRAPDRRVVAAGKDNRSNPGAVLDSKAVQVGPGCFRHRPAAEVLPGRQAATVVGNRSSAAAVPGSRVAVPAWCRR